MDEFCGSKFWDDDLSWNTLDPELTKCFEKTALVWVPCIFLWALSPLDVYFILNSKNRDIPWNWRNLAKIVLTGALVIVTLTDIVTTFTWASCNDSTVYSVDVISPLVKLFTFAFSAVFVYYNRKYGIRTSGLQFLFWLLLLICAIPQLRTEIREAQETADKRSYNLISYTLYFTLVGCITLLSALADEPPRETKHRISKKPCPEQGAGALSRILYTWFDPMAWKGYRNPLVIEDLWDLNPEDSAKEVVPLFEKHWHASLEKSGRYLPVPNGNDAKFNGKFENVDFVPDKKPKKRVSVFPAIIKSFGLHFVAGSILKALGDLLTFINPKILALLIIFVQQGQEPWKGFMYAGLMFATNSLLTFFNVSHMKVIATVGMKMRTVLISAVYKKALRISVNARKEKTVGEIVNLMAVDSSRISMMTIFINMVWSAPLQICLSLYFLWQELGPSVLSGLALMILLIPLNGYIANKVKTMQGKQMKNKDERVKLMNEILNGIKVLKLYAWEGSMEDIIHPVRQKEIKTLRQSAYLNAATSFIWTGAPFLVSLVTFATYACVNTHEVLDAQKAYVSISLFNIIRGPLNMLPMVISNYIQATIALKRINDFLNAEELDPNNVTHEPNKETPVVIENGTFSWGEDPILRDINIKCERNSLGAIVGAVGSGKSSLISACLGEMYKLSGRVNTDGSIAYVSQQAWIQNATLKDNILFGQPYDKYKYEKVVDACALRSDFMMLQAGDATEIGEKGINLSGGQKQRISLARAVYSNADIYLLDDPLSAVDSHVGKHIFENVIGPKGLLSHKTRVLVTHGITYLPQTDKVIVLKDGKVSESGTYLELLNGKGAFAEFLLQHLNEEIDDETELDEITDQLNDTAIGEEVRRISRSRLRVSESISESASERTGNGLYQRQISVASQKSIRSINKMVKSTESLGKESAKVKKGKLIEAEKAETGNVKWEVYKHYIASIGVWLMLSVLLLNITYQAFSVGSNVWVGIWADDNDTMINGTVNTAKRDMYLAVYGVLGIGQAFSTMLSNLLFAKGTIRAAVKIHRQLLHNVMRVPCAFFDITPVGRVLGRFSQDINGIDLRLPNAFQMLMSTIVRVCGTLFVISFSTPLFIAVIIPVAILYIWIQRVYVATSRQVMRLSSVTASPIYSHFGETLSGAQCIRAYKKQEVFIEDSENKVDLNQICQYPTIISSRWLSLRLETIGNLIIFFAALFAVLEREKEPALVGLSVSYALQIFGKNYF
ncbi:unnamed protein product [Acanthoscelides obtectus]|uniref:ABC-type glutathione-S-conjugate transporter n=2 Tax=Acanthoscelides obtectus TaxID=200917 RepID=A0A9P0L0G7_ACAOB|nr:unnamed protein product [Acanthoscelides obtectus]CAK1670542.1 Multidrug resistance-associated protein 1 [Acanthoscelides obtectus]